MSTRTTTNRSGPTARAGVRPGRLLAALAAVLLMAAPTAAQEVCDETAGTLGIQGLRCEGCTFSMSEAGIDRARFRTEPQVLAVVRGFARGDRLLPGDRIVAIDGALITTREGGDRLVDLQAGQAVAVRVRRDGRIEELRITAGSACELTRRVRTQEVELEVMADRDFPPLPPGYRVAELPPPPAEAPQPAPTMPPMPRIPPMPPSGYLGFGIKCGPCGIRDGARFFDENPPVITSVAEDSPADEAGLEPDDAILAIDGHDILSDEGGERFSEIEPGDRVELTVRRGDRRRTVTLEAGERVVRREAPGMMPAPPAPSPRRWSVRPDTLVFGDQPLTFENTPLWVRNEEGELMIILRDAPITIEKDESTGEIVIRSGGRVIRISGGG